MLTVSAEEFRTITGAKHLQARHITVLDWIRTRSGIVFVWPEGSIDAGAAEVRTRALVDALTDKDRWLRPGNPRGSGRHFVRWTVGEFLGRSPTRSESASWSRTITRLVQRGYLQPLEDSEDRKVRVTKYLRLTKRGWGLFAKLAEHEGAVLRPMPIRIVPGLRRGVNTGSKRARTGVNTG